MAGQKEKKMSDDYKQFLKEYDEAELPKDTKPFNTSKYTLMQQLKRFSAFSHTESESEILRKEVQAL